jgi:branched-chain amino acid transport system permease protein
MLYLSAPRLLPIFGLLLLSILLSQYWQRVLLSVSVFALLAISWDILAQSGMVSLGQALFFGTGAYLAGNMNHYLGWPPYVTLPLATIFGGVLCTLFLLPVLRLRGIYFSMVTLVLPLMLVRIIEATRIFGGTEGLSGLDPLPNRWVEMYVIIAALLAALFGFRRLMNSDYGLVLKGINDNDRSVMNAGINIYWFKTQALFIASAIGAFAGAFVTHVYMFVGMPVYALRGSGRRYGNIGRINARRLYSSAAFRNITWSRRASNRFLRSVSGCIYRRRTGGHFPLYSAQIPSI